MSLILRQYADDSPVIGWPRDGLCFVVLSDSVHVGTIVHTNGPAGAEWWGWHVNILLQDGGPPRGAAPTKEQAMQAFAAVWRAWLARAVLAEVTPGEDSAEPDR
jgi:hypothetical protein